MLISLSLVKTHLVGEKPHLVMFFLNVLQMWVMFMTLLLYNSTQRDLGHIESS